MIALDASALLAFLRREPGQARVAAALSDGLLSTVNLIEVLSVEAREGVDPKLLLADLLETSLTFTSLSVQEALLAAELFEPTRPFGLSLGDRACLATAITRGIPVLTADQAWKELDVGVEVEMVR